MDRAVQPNPAGDYLLMHPVRGPLLIAGVPLVILIAVGLVSNRGQWIFADAVVVLFGVALLILWRDPSGVHRRKYLKAFGMPSDRR